MRDIKIIQPENPNDDWTLDFDIVDGYPVLLEEAEMTSDQRAGLSAFVAKGSIPGMLDVGIEWSNYFQQESSDGYIKITNQMQQMVQEYGTSMENRDDNKVYSPLAILDEKGGITVHVIRQ